MEKIYDMIVLGGGPAGYTAAMYAARSGLSTLVLEKLSAGGQMALTEKIDNYPGMEEGIDGFLLGEKMQKKRGTLRCCHGNGGSIRGKAFFSCQNTKDRCRNLSCLYCRYRDRCHAARARHSR